MYEYVLTEVSSGVIAEVKVPDLQSGHAGPRLAVACALALRPLTFRGICLLYADRCILHDMSHVSFLSLFSLVLNVAQTTTVSMLTFSHSSLQFRLLPVLESEV